MTVLAGLAAPPEAVPAAAPEPEGAGAEALVGMGKGGDVERVVGEEVTWTEAVVSVAAVVAAEVVLPKSAGSSMPLSEAQVLGSTPSGQQRPFVRQKEPAGQGSRKWSRLARARFFWGDPRKGSYSLLCSMSRRWWGRSRLRCRRIVLILLRRLPCRWIPGLGFGRE